MIRRKIRPWLVPVAVLTTWCALIAPRPAWAAIDACSITGTEEGTLLDLELPEGETQVACSIGLDHGSVPDLFRVSGGGLIEMAIVLRADADALEQLLVNNRPSGKRYRAMFENPDGIEFELGVNNFEGYPPDVDDDTMGSYGGHLELVFALQRVEGYCAMTATVTGDVSGHFSGDVAYFNAVELAHAVKKGMMVGSIGDTQAHEDVAGLGTMEMSPENALDLAAALGLIGEEEKERAIEDLRDEPAHQEREDQPEGFAEWVQHELRADDPAQGDNFGLNLADLKADVTPKSDALATAMFAGAFTLTVSGRAPDLVRVDGQEQPERMFAVQPSTVTATVGLSEQGGDRIPFEMREGDPVQITVIWLPDDSIAGKVTGELVTKGTYTVPGVTSSPRKLRIRLDATFSALRGSFSCMR